MAVSVVMPALELAQETGKVLVWIKKEGDHVAKGEPLLEIETDKVSFELEAQADASGAIGETIPVRNPTSNNRFRARVEGKGQVAVEAAGGSGKTNP